MRPKIKLVFSHKHLENILSLLGVKIIVLLNLNVKWIQQIFLEISIIPNKFHKLQDINEYPSLRSSELNCTSLPITISGLQIQSLKDGSGLMVSIRNLLSRNQTTLYVIANYGHVLASLFFILY